MITEIKNKKKQGIGFFLFMSTLLLYSLASPGNVPGDTELRWSVSRQIVNNGRVNLEENVSKRLSVVGKDGAQYSFYGPGQSIFMIPVAAAVAVMEKIAGLNPQMADLTGQFVLSVILFPMAGAAAMWMFYRLILLLGYSTKTAVLTSVVFAFGTMNFHYSINTHEQTQIAFCLLAAVYFAVKNQQNRRFLYMWLLSVMLGVCILFRLAGAVVVFAMYVVVVLSDIATLPRKDFFAVAGKWFMAGLVGTGWFIAFYGWYNYIRFGNVFETGYGLANAGMAGYKLFDGNVAANLAAMLASPGKSIFLYNPVLIPAVLCFLRFYRKHKKTALLIATAIVSNFVFYAFFIAWAGDYAWSIRYQVVVLAFMVLPLAELFEKNLKTAAKKIFISLFVVSAAIQLASVVYNFNLEFVQNPNHCIIPDGYVWDVRQSHLVMRVENIAKHMFSERDFSSVEVVDEKPELLKYNHTQQTVKESYRVNFFPFKARGKAVSEKLFYPLLLVWIILLICFCEAICGLVRRGKNK